jgi:hypothetical protein
MKKIFITILIIAVQGIYSNNIQNEQENNVIQFENKTENCIVEDENLKEVVFSNGFEKLNAFLESASRCTSLQQSVLNSYMGDPRFTDQQVVNMAIGAFIACMMAQ